jgi:hypothetical protein
MFTQGHKDILRIVSQMVELEMETGKAINEAIHVVRVNAFRDGHGFFHGQHRASKRVLGTPGASEEFGVSALFQLVVPGFKMNSGSGNISEKVEEFETMLEKRYPGPSNIKVNAYDITGSIGARVCPADSNTPCTPGNFLEIAYYRQWSWTGTHPDDLSINHGMRMFLQAGMFTGAGNSVMDLSFSCTADMKALGPFSCGLDGSFKLAVPKAVGTAMSVTMTVAAAGDAVASFIHDWLAGEDEVSSCLDFGRKLTTVVIAGMLVDRQDVSKLLQLATGRFFMPSPSSIVTWMSDAFQGITGGFIPEVSDQEYINMGLGIQKIFVDKISGSHFSALKEKGFNALSFCEFAATIGWFHMAAITSSLPNGIIPVGETMLTQEKKLDHLHCRPNAEAMRGSCDRKTFRQGAREKKTEL